VIADFAQIDKALHLKPCMLLLQCHPPLPVGEGKQAKQKAKRAASSCSRPQP